MVLTASGESVAVIDRRTKSVLLAAAEHAKASSELFAKIAECCADGQLSERERHVLLVECVHVRGMVTQVEAVIGQ